MSHSGRIAGLVFSFSLAAASGADFQNSLFFGGSGDDVTKGVATDGSYLYVLGETTSTDLPNASGRYLGNGDLFVMKYDPRARAAVWAIYVGGSGRETAAGISVDARGNVWIAGTTASTDFPVTPDALQRAFGGGGADAFVAQLNARGTGVLYATYLGGAGAETEAQFAADRSGNLYVAGTTSGSFPVRNGSSQATFGGGASDVFAVKLGASATRVEFATYLGGSGAERLGAMRVDETGSLFLTGSTASSDFPASANAYQKQPGGATDAFVARFNPGGTGLLYATYLGGSGADTGTGIGPSAGGAFVAMTTASNRLFTSPGAFLRTYNGGASDGYVARLSADGSQIVSATYLGGAGDDTLGALAVGTRRNYSVVFRSNSENWGPEEFGAVELRRRATARVEANFYTNVMDQGEAMQDQPEHSQPPLACEGDALVISHMDDYSGAGLMAGGSTRISNPGSCSPGAMAIGSSGGLTATADFNGPFPPVNRSMYSTQSMRQSSASVGDPVSTATGELYDTFVDLELGGPMQFAFARYYSSVLNESGMQSALGENWMHLFDQTAEVTGNSATIFLFEGKRLQFTRGSGTAPWQLTDKVPNGYQLVSDAAGLHLLSYASRNVFHFNLQGQLVKIEDRNGNALTVTPGPFGPTQVADGLGRTLTFTYSRSKLTRVADQAGRTVAFGHTGANLTTVIAANGRTVTYAFDAGARGGLLLSKTLPMGNRPVVFTYDERGRVVRQTDSRNQSTTIAYGAGQTTVTNPGGVAERHVYGSGVDLTGMTDDQNATASTAYDENGRRTGVTDKTGSRVALTYHTPSGYIASHTDPAGNTTSYTWTAQTQGPFTYYNLTQIRHPGGVTESFAHDAKGNVLTQTLRDGSEQKYTYNARGQILTASNPAGGVTTLTYNDDGTPASSSAPSGVKAAFTYNTAKQLIRVARGGGATRDYAYSPGGLLTRAADELGRAVQWQYDGNDRLTTLTDALGLASQWSYDGDGRPVSHTDRTGGVTQYGYDAIGRLTSLKTAGGRSRAFGYDTRNRLTSVSDEIGKTIEYAYNAEGAPAKVTDGLGRSTEIETNALGKLSKLTTPAGATVTMQYNAFGRVTSVTDPVGRVSEFQYDARGMTSSAKMPGGAAMTWERDKLARPTKVVDPNGNAWTMAYDTSGRLTERKDPLERVTRYGYDDRGRLSGVTLPEGTVEMKYDAASGLASKTYSDGTALAFERDQASRVVKANGVELTYDGEGRVTRSNGIAVERDGDGRIASITYAEGKTVRYTYDARGRLTEVADWSGGGATLEYNAAGELTAVKRANGVAGAYEYDADGQLASAAEGSLSTIALKRNAAGQIVEEERNAPTAPSGPDGEQEFAYDAAHQLAGATYDQMGRLAADSRRTYQWDLASNLRGYTEGDKTVSFAYDAYGNMTAWTSGETARTFVQNYALGMPSVAIERRGDADAAYYVHLPNGRLLYRIAATDGARRYYHYDEVGNTMFVTDDAGAVAESYGITPYGESVASASATENLFLYQGAAGVIRVAPGLYYMRARFYDAATARFLSPDPLSALHPMAASAYQFAAGNPLMNADPQGLWPDWGGMWNAVASGAQAVVDTTVNAATSAGNAVASAATATWNAAVDAGTAVWDAGGRAAEATVNVASSAVNTVSEGVSAAADWAGDRWAQMWTPPAPAPDPPPPPPPSPSQKKAIARAVLAAFGGGGVIANGGMNVIANGGMNVVANGGANVIANGGMNVIANGGANVIANGGMNVIANGGANVIANGGMNVIANGGMNVINGNGSAIVSRDGAGVISRDGAGVINGNGSAVVAMGGAH